MPEAVAVCKMATDGLLDAAGKNALQGRNSIFSQMSHSVTKVRIEKETCSFIPMYF